MADPIVPGSNIADRLAALMVAQKLVPVVFPSGITIMVPSPSENSYSITATFSGDGTNIHTVALNSGTSVSLK